jgi:hypothetical protein
LKKSKYIAREKQKIRSERKSNPFANNSFWKIAFLFSLFTSLISIFIVYQYRPFTLFDNFFFARNDFWCDTKTEGIFGHCFGDFHQGISPDLINDPFPMTENIIVLAVADGYIWKFGNFIFSLIGPKLTLFTFFTIYQMAIITGWYKLKTMYKSNWWLFVFGVTSLPSVLAMMRMNSLCLAFPIFVFYLEAVQSKNRKRQIYLLSICCFFKPQFSALILLNLINREYRFAMVKLIAVISVMYASLLILYNFKITIVFDYFNVVRGFSNSQHAISSFYPVNDSIAHSIAIFYQYLGYSITEFRLQKTISILVILVLISSFIYKPSKNGMDNMYQIVFLVMFGLSGIVSPYYLLILSPIVIHLFHEEKESRIYRLLVINLVLANSYIIIPAFDNLGIVYQSRQMPDYFQITIHNLLVCSVILFFALIAIRIHIKSIMNRIS